MKLRDAGEFLLDRVMRGPVSNARTRERDCDVNVIGGKCLGLPRLARGKLGSHSDFGSSAARIPCGKNEFTSYSADLSVSWGRGFLAACRADQGEAKQDKNYKACGLCFSAERPGPYQYQGVEPSRML
jgi:hypothetical protein